MPLVEGVKTGISNEGVDIGLVIKGDVEGIVVNSLVEVPVLELEIVVDGVVGMGGISGFVEGKSVKLLNGARGARDPEG